MRKFKKVHIGLLFILTILVLYLFVGLPGWDYWNVRRITYSDRVHITRRNMDSARYYMDLFKRVNNRYPSSLSELERFAVDNYQPVNRLTFSATPSSVQHKINNNFYLVVRLRDCFSGHYSNIILFYKSPPGCC